MTRFIPRWFAAMILASLAIVIYGLNQPQQHTSEPGTQTKELYDVLWLDQYPEMQHDKWKAYLFTSDNVGLNIDAASAFKLTLEIFEFKAQNGKLSYHFPHDGRRATCGFRIEKMKKPTRHFDTQLILDADPQSGSQPKTYFTGPEFRSAATLPEHIRQGLENYNLIKYLP